eukprot:TRINITY_DN25669_c0_g1_i1.p1 TRINITY_DN25669_c0_g1~~TRINITY_DN25669_c0_g1_i1.p1  ORF type:complete len:599 (-),score=63.88 TRINITY_DN25669_c0_g1_i1:378-2174(-)
MLVGGGCGRAILQIRGDDVHELVQDLPVSPYVPQASNGQETWILTLGNFEVRLSLKNIVHVLLSTPLGAEIGRRKVSTLSDFIGDLGASVGERARGLLKGLFIRLLNHGRRYWLYWCHGYDVQFSAMWAFTRLAAVQEDKQAVDTFTSLACSLSPESAVMSNAARSVLAKIVKQDDPNALRMLDCMEADWFKGACSGLLAGRVLAQVFGRGNETIKQRLLYELLGDSWATHKSQSACSHHVRCQGILALGGASQKNDHEVLTTLLLLLLNEGDEHKDVRAAAMEALGHLSPRLDRDSVRVVLNKLYGDDDDARKLAERVMIVGCPHFELLSPDWAQQRFHWLAMMSCEEDRYRTQAMFVMSCLVQKSSRSQGSASDAWNSFVLSQLLAAVQQLLCEILGGRRFDVTSKRHLVYAFAKILELSGHCRCGGRLKLLSRLGEDFVNAGLFDLCVRCCLRADDAGTDRFPLFQPCDTICKFRCKAFDNRRRELLQKPLTSPDVLSDWLRTTRQTLRQRLCPSGGWQYKDSKGNIQGPFGVVEMHRKNARGQFRPRQLMRCSPSDPWMELRKLFPMPVKRFESYPIGRLLFSPTGCAHCRKAL